MKVVKAIIQGIANVTPLITGTSCTWQHEVTDVWVVGAVTPFTWVDGLLNIPGYTSGTVLARFKLYTIYGTSSGYFPKDPENPASDIVFWDERLASFPSITNSIEKFETGLNRFKVGNISIQLDDEWNDLFLNSISFSNQANSIYVDDVLIAVVKSSNSSISNFTLRLDAQVIDEVLFEECNFGDPAYLNRIDITSSNAYYNGVNVPAQFQGFVIPMITGSETPYNYSLESTIDGGELVAFPLVTPPKDTPEYLPDFGSAILRLIPTGVNEGIVCRCPSWLTPISTPDTTEPVSSSQIRELVPILDDTILDNMKPGEICLLESATPAVFGARALSGGGSPVQFYIDRPNLTGGGALDNITDVNFTNSTMHVLSTVVPDKSFAQPTISITNLGSGNKLIKVQNIVGVPLDKIYIVFESITGARSAPRVAEWILTSHGLSVDSSFTTIGGSISTPVINQIGQGTSMPNVEDVLGEINRSCLTAIVQPKDDTDYKMVKIDATIASSQTIENEDVVSVSKRDQYKGIAKTVIFEPKYAISPDRWSDLYVEITNLNVESFYGTKKTVTIPHIFDTIPLTRFQEIAEFWGNPDTQISFDLLNDDIVIDVGDYVTLNSETFIGKILILSINTLEVGRKIIGRFLYDH